MIDDIRWLYKSNGEKVLQANDGYVWFDINEVPFHYDSPTKPCKEKGILGTGCGICGGIKVYIRGARPGYDNRLVCPTCIYERLERIHTETDPNYGVANCANP